jgi:RNA polymerase sigma-32 factor
MEKEIKPSLPAIATPGIIAARGVSDDSGLDQYLQTIQKFPILSAEQEYEFAIKWRRDNDKFAAEQLVASHLRLVAKVAYDFKNYGIPVADLIASGNLGLMQALQKFDPERGFRFSTYAMFWIKAEIYDTILANWSIVRIGTSANQKRVFFNLAKAKRALGIMDRNMSDTQVRQIANYLEVPDADVERMSKRIGARDLSLNSPAHNNDENSDEQIANLADNSIGIEDKLEHMEFRLRGHELLKKHMSELPQRDQEILKARRLQNPAATLEVLSQKYGISRERVRQIEERAYEKLRAAILKDEG